MLILLLACTAGGPDSSGGDDSAVLFPACRTDADCTDGSSCWVPGSCNVGDYESPPDACAGSGDCGEGLVCQPIAESCGVAAHTECVTSCVTAGCPDGERCDEASGVCGTWSCADGFTCPAHTTCQPGFGDRNDCLRDLCSTDAECGGGACVKGACYDELGTCEWAVP